MSNINGVTRAFLSLDESGISLRSQEEKIDSINKSQRMNIEPLPNKRESPIAVLNRYRNSKN